MHLFGADLDFAVLAVGTHDRGVQRLVEIGARDGDEIFDASGHGTPLIVDDAERAVAVLDGIRDDAQGEKVVDLFQRDLLAL